MSNQTRQGISNADRSRSIPMESRAAPTATQYVRLDALLSMVPMSPSTVWRKVRDRSFPRPVKLSARITAWNREAVEAWIAEREAS